MDIKIAPPNTLMNCLITDLLLRSSGTPSVSRSNIFEDWLVWQFDESILSPVRFPVLDFGESRSRSEFSSELSRIFFGTCRMEKKILSGIGILMPCDGDSLSTIPRIIYLFRKF
jgi:hypothetical protein